METPARVHVRMAGALTQGTLHVQLYSASGLISTTGVAVPAGQQALDLLDPAGCQPPARSSPYPLGERGCIAGHRDEARAVAHAGESMLALPGAQRLARQLPDLEGAADAHQVVGVQPGGALGIDGEQARVERRASLALRRLTQPVAHLGAGGGHLGQPEEQRLDPQERAPAHHGHATARPDVADGA